ncbi:radical SAM protein [Carboxydocella sp. ULO1]|uniref:SPL family radical SAM protein n=1 Tax=Carboxydocella sp. ULO1 TaxID=1926599 RepID=UPI0009AD302F|nr:radical SAM protein [Carboxydocella sp. ULO1]GAW27550.1 hypothetical protein ULO1_01200 [Carboxydocella sp. ULO1]
MAYIRMKKGKAEYEYPVIPAPVPHILVDSKKDLHGWWPGKRECTAERMLINPYNGCTHDCPYCYAHSFWGYFHLYATQRVVTVCQDFDRIVARQLDSLRVAACGYLSPVTDPFQPLNRVYKLSEKIIRVFVERNLPIEFITKNQVTDEALAWMSKQQHCFGQVSLLTPDEDLRRKLVPGGAPVPVLLDNLRRIREAGLFAVVRLDPILPGLTDDQEMIEELCQVARAAGASHLVASCLDIPLALKNRIWQWIELSWPDLAQYWARLYNERIGASWHADLGYRRELFSRVKKAALKYGLSFALCMEYRPDGQGLNREFATTRNCEGIDIPIYIRRGQHFEPVACDGACLTCQQPVCGLPELAGGGAWKLKDYRRWSRIISQEDEI